MPDHVSAARTNLRLVRLQAMMTQEELAAKAGVGIRTIRDIESGKVRPQSRTLRLLIEALELDKTDSALLSGSSGRTTAVPRELPRAPAVFAGRDDDLDAILAAVRDGATVVTVHGMAGVGKTHLLVKAAHRLAPQYPDGQVFVDLHGFTGSHQSLGLASVLARVLRSLGLSEQEIPTDFEELTARYRSRISDRRVLLVFDNAVNSEQVEALLPGTQDSLVLATSRRNLSSLAGTCSVLLEPPPMPGAIAMLVAALPGRIGQEDAAALAQRCGRLPLAMGLMAARLRTRPLWNVQDLLERLTNEDSLLDVFNVGHRGVAAALTASYVELDAAQSELLRRLSIMPGSDVDCLAAGALCAVSAEKASAMLESLVDVHLAQSLAPGRYQLHDLVRLFGSQLVKREETKQNTNDALTRLFDLYIHLAYKAAAIVWPHQRNLTEGAITHDLGLAQFTDRFGALSWFHTERANLEAAVIAAHRAGETDRAWHLATSFNAFLMHDPDVGSHLTVNQIALDIAQRANDGKKEARALAENGRQLLSAGKTRDAIVCLDRAAALKQELNDNVGAALTLTSIGVLHRRSGRFDKAVATHKKALTLAEEAADMTAVALIGVNLVVPLIRLGRLTEAENSLRYVEQRLDISDVYNRIRVIGFRGILARERGDSASAESMHTTCLDSCLQENIPSGVVTTLIELGEDLLCLGRSHEAITCFTKAVERAEKLADPSLERSARNSLGHALVSVGKPPDAANHFQRALALAKTHGDSYELARAHHGLARLSKESGDVETEHRYLRYAAREYADCGASEVAIIAELLGHHLAE